MTTLNVREQTHQRVLPQLSALESVSADKERVSTKRGIDAGVPAAGVQHGRGETGTRQTVSASRAASTGAAQPGGGNPATPRNNLAARVFVLDRHGQPLQPCHPARARELLAQGRAVVHRRTPFVIRLKDRTVEDSTVAGVEVGIDPGSKHTGLAVFTTDQAADPRTGEVTTAREAVWLGELVHRGLAIKNKLHARAALRRGRRGRNLRYRAPRFLNRARKARPNAGSWLPPSLWHRLDTTQTWMLRLSRWAPVTAVHVEQVRFDLQLLQDPTITGVRYQQGTLAGYEVREYLLEKWGRRCVYCDAPGTGPDGVPLNIDHVRPQARGGSHRPSNLVTACIPCNQRKDARPVEEFLADDPARLRRILASLKRPLAHAAAVNATRRAIVHMTASTGLPVYVSTGGRTKYNRHVSNVPKSHALDALCVGDVDVVTRWPALTHVAHCTGRGSYSRTASDKYGFPRLRLTRQKTHFGLITGDLVRAVVPSGKKQGTHVGRVAVRATGSCNITTNDGAIQGIGWRRITLIQRGDGYRHSSAPTPERR
ncbi:RNA-guided endonuclease IscB [Leucobacter sp. HY1910]